MPSLSNLPEDDWELSKQMAAQTEQTDLVIISCLEFGWYLI
jgi:hypothetical protein